MPKFILSMKGAGVSKKYNFTFIDLFAGLGGFHLALKSLGGKCVFASELKEDLRKLYQINFPGTPIFGDITKIEPSDIPSHDMICGGFPCQPFSQAGKRLGFNDKAGRGNLFYFIRNIIEYHKPKFILLENVQNLESHDNGNTWNFIETSLKQLGYQIDKKILSPHQFGIPQHRKRIYIVGVREDVGGLKKFKFPEATNETCDIKSIINEQDADVVKLRPASREYLSVWQEFIDLTIAHGEEIPRFPIWAMEFGASYDYEEKAPYLQGVERLNGKRGHLGKVIRGKSLDECLSMLPVYAQSTSSEQFPDWKIRYIAKNREFYERNKDWLKEWMKKVSTFENSFLKLEWNCGNEYSTKLLDKIIQFRASGIRVKSPTFAPALNLCGTQIPIFPWVRLPNEILEPGEPRQGRYMTLREAAAIQGMQKIELLANGEGLTLNRSYEALGNAVNVDLMRKVAKNLLRCLK